MERARILLAYRDEPWFYAVGRAIGVTHQTVRRCVDRAVEQGVVAALGDSPRPGREPEITAAARNWLVDLVCRKPTDLGYPHELWTTRLLARHACEHGAGAVPGCLPAVVQGMVCKILARHAVKPHKRRYYLERRDPAFEGRMAEVRCVYREVEMLRQTGAAGGTVAIVSYDEKPDVQAIGTTAPNLPPQPGKCVGFARDYEYVCHGTLSLLAGIDLLTGTVHALVEDRHRSAKFIAFLEQLDAAYPAATAIKLILDNHSPHVSKKTTAWLATRPAGRFIFVFTPRHGS